MVENRLNQGESSSKPTVPDSSEAVMTTNMTKLAGNDKFCSATGCCAFAVYAVIAIFYGRNGFDCADPSAGLYFALRHAY